MQAMERTPKVSIHERKLAKETNLEATRKVKNSFLARQWAVSDVVDENVRDKKISPE